MNENIVSTPEHKLPPPPAPPPAPPRKRSGMRWLWLPVLLLIGVAAYIYWPKSTNAGGAAQTPAGGGGKKGGRGAGGPPPVVATRAHRGDIGVYFSGLGSVTPINTVTVKSRVDGELMAVNYKEGDTVKKGDLLMEIDPRPYAAILTQAQGALIRDEALLQNARVDLARYQTLVAQNAVPEQQLTTQKALVTQEEGIVKSDQGQIASAQVNLDYCRITSPITGRVGLRLVDPGNIVHASDTNGLVVITQIQPISVIFTISEDQLPAVLQKMRAGQQLEVDAYDRDKKALLTRGALATIDNEIDQTTGTVRVRANFENKDDALFPNQFVNARVLVQQKRNVVLLNTAAIQRSSNTTYVYLVKPDSTVTVRDVAIGTTEGDESEITSGLAPGDEVVMTGVDRLQEGVKVTATIPGETPAGRGAGKSGAGKSGSGKKGAGKSTSGGGGKQQ
jgi:multidrug efflux system membrane fusion protein